MGSKVIDLIGLCYTNRFDQGVLIVSYSKTSQKIVGLAFWFADERPKALRRTFEFDVASFDTSTGTVTIRTKKGEQGAARNSR